MWAVVSVILIKLQSVESIEGSDCVYAPSMDTYNICLCQEKTITHDAAAASDAHTSFCYKSESASTTTTEGWQKGGDRDVFLSLSLSLSACALDKV